MWWLGSGPGNLSQNDLKLIPLTTSSAKNPKLKVIFHCKLEDLPHLLSIWTALQLNCLKT